MDNEDKMNLRKIDKDLRMIRKKLGFILNKYRIEETQDSYECKE